MATLSELRQLFGFGQNAIRVTPDQTFKIALNENILLSTTGTGWTDLWALTGAGGLNTTEFHLRFQGNTANTAGTVILESTPDIAVTGTVVNMLYYTGTNPTTFSAGNIGIASNQVLDVNVLNPLEHRYVRARVNTAFTGTTPGVRCLYLEAKPAARVPKIFQTFVNNTVGVGTVATVTTVSNTNNVAYAIPNAITDVTNAAITTTTTSAAFTPTSGLSYVVHIPVTAIGGTSPTLQIDVQESPDAATNWQTVYSFPIINATGSYKSPSLPNLGNRVRYVQTITGTTPSFTRAINRVQSQSPAVQAILQGRQNWCASYEGGVNFTNVAALVGPTQYYVDGVSQGTGTYTVPVGKRLRITNLSFSGFSNSFLAANSTAYDDGWIAIAYAASGISVTSARAGTTAFDLDYTNPTAVQSTGKYRCVQQFQDGVIDIPGGWQVSAIAKSSQATGTSLRMNGGLTGYLYNA